MSGSLLFFPLSHDRSDFEGKRKHVWEWLSACDVGLWRILQTQSESKKKWARALSFSEMAQFSTIKWRLLVRGESSGKRNTKMNLFEHKMILPATEDTRASVRHHTCKSSAFEYQISSSSRSCASTGTWIWIIMRNQIRVHAENDSRCNWIIDLMGLESVCIFWGVIWTLVETKGNCIKK